MYMSIGFVVWLGAAVAVGSTWVFRWLLVSAALRSRQALGPTTYDGPPKQPPMVSILVAAKDEQDHIETCVNSLLAQDYPNFEVIVINDRSSDDTASILNRLASRHKDRLTVIHIATLRDGWFGKNNAMREGITASRGPWLLLTDADCRFTATSTLSMATREVLAHNVSLLSITPQLDTPTVWERAIQPVCGLVLISWFLPTRVNDPNTRTAYANGAFMLIKRSAYDAIGGHERVKTEVNEDVCMAGFAKSQGLGLRVVESAGLYRTRMHPSLAAAWNGWSRIYFGCLRNMRRLTISASLLVALSIVPWLSLLIALSGWAMAPTETAEVWGWSAFAWSLAVLCQQTVATRIYAMLGQRRFWSLGYVVGAVVALGMLLSAMLKVLGATSTTWRGTTYRGQSLETGIGETPVTRRPADAVEESARHA